MISLKVDLWNTTLEDFEEHFKWEVTILPVGFLQATGAIPIPAHSSWGEPVSDGTGWHTIGWVWVDGTSVIHRVDVTHVVHQADMSWTCRVGLHQPVLSGFDLKAARYQAGCIQVSLFDWDAFCHAPRAFYVPKVWQWLKSCWGDAAVLVEVVPDARSSVTSSASPVPPAEDSAIENEQRFESGIPPQQRQEDDDINVPKRGPDLARWQAIWRHIEPSVSRGVTSPVDLKENLKGAANTKRMAKISNATMRKIVAAGRAGKL